jgi:hypothetical protein
MLRALKIIIGFFFPSMLDRLSKPQYQCGKPEAEEEAEGSA